MKLYVLFIHQLTCHFISYNIMRVLLNSIKWSFNWKALLHFPIICSKLKADAYSLIRIQILFPENQKSLSPCQDLLQIQVNFEPHILFVFLFIWEMNCLVLVNWRPPNGWGNNCSPYYVRSGPVSGFIFDYCYRYANVFFFIRFIFLSGECLLFSVCCLVG